MLAASLALGCNRPAAPVILNVDASAARHPISPDIYGIVSYNLDAAFAREIHVANVRWGGDVTSPYNWEVDSGNSGYDWYFMGGSGAPMPPTPGTSVDLMVKTYKPANANALVTIPILPYIQQGGLLAGQFYLQQMAAYERTHNQRLLDYFDEHYYFDVSTPPAQLASTRTLWDPTFNGGTWVEKYAFHGPMRLIPRFRSWIDTNYPGTKLALSEYSIDSGKKSIVDAIAEMDVLGIFGRDRLDFANMWTPPAPTDPIAYSFRMFRNYDGKGHAFGDTSLNAASSDPASLSLYAAQRTSDDAVTILVINKTTAPITSAVAFKNMGLPISTLVYEYSAANLRSIVHQADASIADGRLTYSFPGYSAVMFVIAPTPPL